MPTPYIMNSSVRAAKRLSQGLVVMVEMVVGGRVAVSKRYQRLPPWSTLVEPNARTPASASVQRVELTPYQVAERVVHVVKARVLVRLALVGVALQL